MQGSKKQARQVERKRCARILRSPAGKRFPSVATALAFDTDWQAGHCIAILDHMVENERLQLAAGTGPLWDQFAKRDAVGDPLPATIN